MTLEGGTSSPQCGLLANAADCFRLRSSKHIDMVEMAKQYEVQLDGNTPLVDQ